MTMGLYFRPPASLSRAYARDEEAGGRRYSPTDGLYFRPPPPHFGHMPEMRRWGSEVQTICNQYIFCAI